MQFSMFQRKAFQAPLPVGAPHYQVSKVVQKTDGEIVDSVTVRDFSENFKDFPRNLESENFSIPAQQASGLSMKEVNSVVFHNDELSQSELSQIDEVINKKDDDVEPTKDKD